MANVKGDPSLTVGAVSIVDQARDIRHYCLYNKFNHMTIVTDVHKTRCVLYAFNRVFKNIGIRLEFKGAPNKHSREYDWWKSDSGIRAYILGSILYLKYRLTSYAL